MRNKQSHWKVRSNGHIHLNFIGSVTAKGRGVTVALRACAKVRGGREGTGRRERQGNLTQARGKAAAWERRACGRAIQSSPWGLPRLTSPWASAEEPDSGRRGKQNLRPDLKGPSLDRDQKPVTGSKMPGPSSTLRPPLSGSRWGN